MIAMLLMAFLIPAVGLLICLKFLGWKVKPQNDRVRVFVFTGTTLTVGTITALLLYWGGTSFTRFHEVWNYQGKEVRYYEDWNEYIHQTCTRQVPSGTDSKGNTTYTTETYDCSYVSYHPEKWRVVNEYDHEESISKKTYLNWVKIFTDGDGSKFFDMKRDYHNDDGDMYFAKWRGEFDHSMPLHSVHVYTNKVRVAHTVFSFPEPTEEMLQLWPRPADRGLTHAIHTDSDIPVSAADQLLLRRINAKHGRAKQVHLLVMLFKNGDRFVVSDILSSWQGVNKNELVTFLSVDDNLKPQWCEVHSWMDDTTIHAQIQSDLLAVEKWSAPGFVKVVEKALPLWHRKEFADFEYLKVPISFGWFLSQFLITVALTGGLGTWLHLGWDIEHDFRYNRGRSLGLGRRG